MNILDLSQFKDLKSLQEYADKQYKTIAIMKSKVDEQSAKISHLETLLSSRATILTPGSEQKSICEIEINRLYQKTLRGPLEFAEVKVLETLTKLLLAMEGKEPPAEKEKALSKAVKAMTPQELINIALQKTPEEQEGN
jgi:hypothetical protein